MSTTTSTYQPGDVVLLDFPFTDASGSKRRPALVLLDAGDADVVVAPITSRLHGSPYDVAISRWRAAHLRLPSTVRLHKVATAHRRSIHGRLGALHADHRRQVGSALDGLWRSVVTALRL